MNIYASKDTAKSLESILPGLRVFGARVLSCKDRALQAHEISIRILVPEASVQIADTEIEMNAHSYPERVSGQDTICRSIRDYIQSECPRAGSVYVWLQLSELGHSG